MIERLNKRLAAGEIILHDGATGTELERRGVPMDAAAWSAAAILTHPETVRAVHEDYIRAGVDVVTSNSFSTARHQLGPAGLDGSFRELNRQAVALARQARDNAADRPVLVAGSISSVHFEKEYVCPVAEAAANFRQQAEILAEAGADLLIMEMMWDIEYSSVAVRAAVATGLPVWIGFCCRLARDSTVMLFSEKYVGTLSSALGSILGLGGSAVNIMHTETREVVPALRLVMERWSGPVGVYAHSGRFVMPNWHFNDVISPAAYLAEAEGWVGMGAQIIGGCCGIGPDHIRLLRHRLPSHSPASRIPAAARCHQSSVQRVDSRKEAP